MKKFNEMSTKDKITKVGIPAVIIIILLILGIVYFTGKDTQPTNVEVSETTEVDSTVNSDLTLDVDTIEKTEDETVVEPEVTESEVEETIVEEPTEVVETEVEEPEVTPPTEVDENADVNVPVDAGETYNFEGDNKVEAYEATVPDNYDLPYIVNGRDIRGGDIDGDGVTDNHGNTWYQGKIFVGSNGVKVRIADAYDVNATIGHPDAIFRDGTENIEPGSDWLYAVNEYLGTVDLHSIDVSSLPSVNTVSSKQTTINDTDSSYLAYKAVFDPLWSLQNVGHDGGFSALQTIDKNHDGQVDGIGLLSALGVTGYMWEMRYDSDNGYWKLEIKGNYTELIWNSIHNSIRMITPDADAVYNAIYEACYYDNQISENPGVWCAYGNTSVMWDSSRNKADFLIK